MRGLADALFSRTRKAAIGALFAPPAPSLHLRELARMAGVTPTMMSKELDGLVGAGLVLERRDGNRRVFSANPATPIHAELAGIALKTAGLADVLRTALAPVDGIQFAFVFGSIARGAAHAGSDVDLLVVGQLAYAALLSACHTAVQRLGRPVNPTLYAPDEWAALRAAPDNAFMSELRRAPRITLIGSDDDIAAELDEPARNRATGRSSGERARTAPAPRARARSAR